MRPLRTTFFLSATFRSITNAGTLSPSTPRDIPNGPRLSALYDRYGQSPCALEERIKSACPQPPGHNFVPPTSLNQSALPCTCNVIFFNLWSACLVSVGNSILPTFDQWSQSCNHNSLNISNCPSDVNAIPLPPWARIAGPNPTNTTFDVGHAISIAQVSKGMPWTLVQILAPVLSALATVAILGCWYLYQYSQARWHKAPMSRRGPSFFRNGAHKVRERTRNETWTIDLTEPPANQHMAKGYMWSDGPAASKQGTLAGQGHRHTPSAESNTKFGSWKSSFLQFNKPPTVRSVTPGNGWRISSVDHSTESGLSPKPVPRGPTFDHPIIEDDDSDDENDMDGPRPEGAREETDQLLSPSVRSDNTVFLISHRPGEDFTIESSHHSPPAPNRGGLQRRFEIDPPEEQSLRPSESSKSKSFSFLPKIKVTMPGKSSRSDARSYSNGQNPPPPSRAPSADNPSLPSSLSRQASPFPELFPLARSPSAIHSRSATAPTAHGEPNSYSQLHPNRPQGSPSPFQSIHQQRNSREEISFLEPRASHSHWRPASSHHTRGSHPAMLRPGSAS